MSAFASHRPHDTAIEVLGESQNWRCAYCGCLCVVERPRVGESHRFDAATRDHLVPQSRGGENGYEHEVLACWLCNHGRGAHDCMAYFAIVQEHGRHRAPFIVEWLFGPANPHERMTHPPAPTGRIKGRQYGAKR